MQACINISNKFKLNIKKKFKLLIIKDKYVINKCNKIWPAKILANNLIAKLKILIKYEHSKRCSPK